MGRDSQGVVTATSLCFYNRCPDQRVSGAILLLCDGHDITRCNLANAAARQAWTGVCTLQYTHAPETMCRCSPLLCQYEIYLRHPSIQTFPPPATPLPHQLSTMKYSLAPLGLLALIRLATAIDPYLSLTSQIPYSAVGRLSTLPTRALDNATDVFQSSYL